MYLYKLREAIGGDDADLMEMIESFLEEVPSLAKALLKSVAEGDAVGARRASHSLKSNTHDFGALEVSKAFALIEVSCSNGVLPDESEFSSLQTSLEQVCAELQDVLRKGTL